MKPFNRFQIFLLFGGIFLLAAAGCAGSGDSPALPEVSSPAAPTAVPTFPPTPVPTEAPLPTAVPTPLLTDTPDVAKSCLIGRWIVTDMSPYFQTAFEGTDITYQGTSGNAWYQFNLDGSILLEAIEFTQSASIKVGTTEIPMDVILDGVGFASYRIEGNKVIFDNQQTSGIVFQVEVFGERTDLEAALLGDAAKGEVAFLYECVGSNQLQLTPPLNDYAVFPILLERYE